VRRLLNAHFVRITAHPRHLSDSPFLRDLDLHHQVRGTWDKRIFDVRNREAQSLK
jgi:hypothetical protein